MRSTLVLCVFCACSALVGCAEESGGLGESASGCDAVTVSADDVEVEGCSSGAATMENVDYDPFGRVTSYDFEASCGERRYEGHVEVTYEDGLASPSTKIVDGVDCSAPAPAAATRDEDAALLDGPADSPVVDAYCNAGILRAICEAQAGCCDAASFSLDVDACVDASREGCEAYVNEIGRNAELDATANAECDELTLEELDTCSYADEWAAENPRRDACARVWVGKQAPGAPCWLSVQCAPAAEGKISSCSLYDPSNSAVGDTEPGFCEQWAISDEGDGCDEANADGVFAVCDYGFACIDGRCEAVREAGAACEEDHPDVPNFATECASQRCEAGRCIAVPVASDDLCETQ